MPSGLITLTKAEIAAIRGDLGAGYVPATPPPEAPFEYRDTAKDAHYPTRKAIRYSTLHSTTIAKSATEDTTVSTVSADALLLSWGLSWVAYCDSYNNITYVRARLEILRNGDTVWLQHCMAQTYRVMYVDAGAIKSSYALEAQINGNDGRFVLLAGDVVNLWLTYVTADIGASSASIVCFPWVNTQPFR